MKQEGWNRVGYLRPLHCRKDSVRGFFYAQGCVRKLAALQHAPRAASRVEGHSST